MDDSKIVELYWERSENAIVETSKKYSRYCRYISFNILHNNEDAEECVNDTYMRAWNSVPPHRPNCLSTFLGKITRNLSYDKYKKYNAEKRGFGQTDFVLSELDECVPSSESVEQTIDEMALVDAINRFLTSLTQTDRKVFMRRYWYASPIKEIAGAYGMNESKVKSILFRARNKLKLHLEKEGVL
ncbi:MAG: RNA polymerase sigma factor [Desulfotomaculaceae bacterium]|nr:RNA polymerase sigma factor [Desulfotomaculaceae bacterium]